MNEAADAGAGRGSAACPLPWQGEMTVAEVRRMAWRCLSPGTLYEVRSSIPEDFGRKPSMVWYVSWPVEDRVLPYVPGKRHLNLLFGVAVHCREYVRAAAEVPHGD